MTWPFSLAAKVFHAWHEHRLLRQRLHLRKTDSLARVQALQRFRPRP